MANLLGARYPGVTCRWSMKRRGEKLRLQVLGGVTLDRGDGGPATPILRQPKRFALLAYLALALPRGFHRRDTLLAMFWPEADRGSASRSLRQALYFLRTALPQCGPRNRGTEEVGLDVESIACDASDFEQLLEHGREAEALALYRGDLLPGFHLEGCADFERWLDLERGRLHRRAVRAALILASRAASAGESEQAAEWANLAADRDPEDGRTVSQAAEILIEIGDHAGAERIERRLRERLEFVEGEWPMRQSAPDVRRSSPAAARDGRAAPGPARMVAAVNADSTRALQVPVHVPTAAQHEYVRGAHHDARRTPGHLEQAIVHYRRAISLAPNFARAHAALARGLTIASVYSARRSAAVQPEVKHHASKALALDSSIGTAYGYAAMAAMCYEWDWSAAERLLDRGVVMSPESVDLRVTRGLYFFTALGCFEEALHEMERARELDPASLPINAYMGMVSYFARQPQRALREVAITMELDATFPVAWWVRGLSCEQLGRANEAVAAYDRAVELTNGSALMRAQLARAYALAGDRERATALLYELAAPSTAHETPSFFLASVCAALGDAPAAMEWLRRSYQERAPQLLYAAVFPALDPMREEPGFRELMLRIGLAQVGGRSSSTRQVSALGGLSS